MFPHQVTYISDTEFNSLRTKICKQIDNNEWDDISFDGYVYAICKRNGEHTLFAEEVRKILLQNKPYNDHIEQTVIRLFGSRQYLDEARHYMNWNRLRYDIDKGNIFDLNGSKYSEPLFIYYMNDYIENNIGQKTKFDNAKFLIDRGADINIQDDNGRTILHNFVYRYRTSIAYFEGLKLYVEFIDFLLENGSDPFLSDKKGNTPYNIVMNEVQLKKKYRFISRNKIMELLKDHSIIDTQVRLCEIFYSLMQKYII